MDKADTIPENAPLIWNIAMMNISREKDGKLVLCKNVMEYKELCINIDRSMREYKRTVDSAFLGDHKLIIGRPWKSFPEHVGLPGEPSERGGVNNNSDKYFYLTGNDFTFYFTRFFKVGRSPPAPPPRSELGPFPPCTLS